MKRYSIFFLIISFLILVKNANSDILDGKRCNASPAPDVSGGESKCEIYVDGKLYQKKKYFSSTCVCPPESQLPPKASPEENVITITPVFTFSKKGKKSDTIKINTFIDGNKKKKINFDCTYDAQGIVDENRRWTGSIMCKILSKDKKGKLTTFAEIKYANEEDFSKGCKCIDEMTIPLGSLKTTGLRAYNAIINPVACKIIDTASSEKSKYQYCRLEIEGKEMVYFDQSVDDCEKACENYKQACSVSEK